MMKPLYPGAASRYVKKVIETCEREKDEKSTIIHCTMPNISVFSAARRPEGIFVI